MRFQNSPSRSHRARTFGSRFGRQWFHHWRMLAVLAVFVAPPRLVGVAAGNGETRARIRSSYLAGRLGDAIDASRDLVNELVVQFSGELRASLPPPLAGWSMVDTTETPPNLDAFVAGVFNVGARYTHADGRRIDIRLNSVSYDTAKVIREHVLGAVGADRISLSLREGRWVSTGGATPSESLVVLLVPGSGLLHADMRGSTGVTREVLLRFATDEHLTEMMARGFYLGDLRVPIGDGPRVEARLVDVEEWYSKGRKVSFSIPLRATRAAVAALAALRGRRLTDQVRGVPIGWIPDDDPICDVSPTRRVSVFSRRYRKNSEGLVVSACLGASGGKEVEALRPAGIHWGEWVPLPEGRGNRRMSVDRGRIEIEIAFPGPSSRFVVFGDGPQAVLAAERLVVSNDFGALWLWILEH